MKEKDLECKLVKAVMDSGGLAIKFISPNLNGVPDRLLLFPEGRTAFAEMKVPGEKPRPLQVHRIEQLRELGFRVYVVDSDQAINSLLREIPFDWDMVVVDELSSFKNWQAKRFRALMNLSRAIHSYGKVFQCLKGKALPRAFFL